MPFFELFDRTSFINQMESPSHHMVYRKRNGLMLVKNYMNEQRLTPPAAATHCPLR